jgi:hypothetical protein
MSPVPKMMITRFFAAALVAGLALGQATQARATETGVFDISLGGIRAAVVQYAANTEGNRYAVTGKMNTTGLLGAVVRASYEATARGTEPRPGQYRPTSFTEVRDASKEVSRAEMLFRSGRPQIKTYDPPRKSDRHAVDPATQSGTVDPMTVIYAALRDQPRERVCDLSLQVFDGKRRSEVRLSDPAEASDGRITCQGVYRRIAGWSPESLAERSRFPFQMTYAPKGEGVWRVVRVTTDTTFGRAVLQRR